MAQRVLFTYKNPDSTENYNSRIARIMSPGPYNGLMCYANTPADLFINVTAGDALTIEGVKIEYSEDETNKIEIAPGDLTRRRIDLICIYHKYVYGATIPPGNLAEFKVITGDLPLAANVNPTAPYHKIDKYYLPLCEVHVDCGAMAITDNMLHNLARVPTTKGLYDDLAETLYRTWGNFAYYGWDVIQTSDTQVSVTEGRGLLCGKNNHNESDILLSDLVYAEYLREMSTPNGPLGSDKILHQHLSLMEQPDFPSQLAIKIITGGHALEGYIYISGADETGAVIDRHPVFLSQEANTTKTYYTEAYFAEVLASGIDFYTNFAEIPGYDIAVSITDRPINFIVATGTPSGIPIFRIELNPNVCLNCNELIIAKVFTDVNSIIEIIDLDITPMALWEDKLICNGSSRSFYASAHAAPKSDSLWYDGLRVFNDYSENYADTFGKGYKLNGREITLGPAHATPDANTVLRFLYKRIGSGSSIGSWVRACGETEPLPPPVPTLSYDNNWVLTHNFGESLSDIYAASDGKIYITGTSKIWVTTDMINFTQCVLNGVKSSSRFGQIIEANNQRIITSEGNAVWVKPAGSNTFTRYTLRFVNHYYDTDTFYPAQSFPCPIAGNKSSNIIHVAQYKKPAFAGAIMHYNIDNLNASDPEAGFVSMSGYSNDHYGTVVGSESLSLSDNTNCIIGEVFQGWVTATAIDASNNISRYEIDSENAEPGIAFVENLDNSVLSFAKSADGSAIQMRKSTDKGLMWSLPANLTTLPVTTYTQPRSAQALPEGSFLISMSADNSIRRLRDDGNILVHTFATPSNTIMGFTVDANKAVWAVGSNSSGPIYRMLPVYS